MANSNGKEFSIKLDGKEYTVFIRRPNQQELFEIDLAYRKAMTQLLKAGVMTRFKAAKLFEVEETWTDQDEKELQNLSILIAQNANILDQDKDKNDHEDNMKIVNRITELRAKQLALIARKNSLFDNCAERQAEEQKMHAFARLCCTRKDTNHRLFDSDEQYQDFLTNNVESASIIFAETYSYEYGVDVHSISDEWSEVKYLNDTNKAEQERKELEVKNKETKKVKRKKAKELVKSKK
jgi:hypothetical protein